MHSTCYKTLKLHVDGLVPLPPDEGRPSAFGDNDVDHGFEAEEDEGLSQLTVPLFRNRGSIN